MIFQAKTCTINGARSLLSHDHIHRQAGGKGTAMQRVSVRQMCRLGTVALVAAIWCGFAPPAYAEPLFVSATLSGDGRLDNPDDLSVLVTIAGDTTSNVSSWVIDLAMSDRHPAAAVHEVYFNLLGSSTDYTIANVSPATWSLTDTDVKNAKGSGNADFMFELQGPNNTAVGGVSLSFDVLKKTGLFTAEDFLLAGDGCSRDAALGCGQFGAHIGSLTDAPRQADSGFALGDYSLRTTAAQVPEPALLALMGAGAAGFLVRRRQRRRST